MDIIIGIIQVFYLVLWAYVYIYITKLENIGCECSKDWRRNFIKMYSVVLIILIITFLIGIKIYYVGPVIMFFTIFFIFTVFHYIHDLKVKKCECSKSNIRDILEVVNYIQVGLIIFAMLVIAIGMIWNISSEGNESPIKVKRVKNNQVSVRRIRK